MIKICACDDNELQRELLVELLNDYVANRKEELQIVAFEAASEVLDYVKKEGGFDIYILDLIMPIMDGMELARELRKINENGRIVFLTSSMDYVFQAFDVKAYNYLLKPVSVDKLKEVLDKALLEIHAELPMFTEIKTKYGMHRVHVDNIYYITHENRVLHYHLAEGKEFESTSLRCSVKKMVESLLEGKRFVMAGSSMVINMSQIDTMDNYCVTLKDGTVLFPPERSYNQLKTDWKNFNK